MLSSLHSSVEAAFVRIRFDVMDVDDLRLVGATTLLDMSAPSMLSATLFSWTCCANDSILTLLLLCFTICNLPSATSVRTKYYVQYS